MSPIEGVVQSILIQNFWSNQTWCVLLLTWSKLVKRRRCQIINSFLGPWGQHPAHRAGIGLPSDVTGLHIVNGAPWKLANLLYSPWSMPALNAARSACFSGSVRVVTSFFNINLFPHFGSWQLIVAFSESTKAMINVAIYYYMLASLVPSGEPNESPHIGPGSCSQAWTKAFL